MNKKGVKFSDHGLSRALDRAINKNRLTYEYIIKIDKSNLEYIQTSEGRFVYSNRIIHLLRNPNTGDIVSVSDRKKPRKDWERINGENKHDNKNDKESNK